MKNLVLTICTRNYIGLAYILRDSIRKYYSDADFAVFVVDSLEGVDSEDDLYDVESLGLYDQKVFRSMAFKYTLTELCTAVKPTVLEYALEVLGYEKVLYFDPDILVFSSIKEIYDELEDNMVLLTPHVLTFPSSVESKKIEDGLLKSGIFNLGFIGVKKKEKTIQMLQWWKDNLIDKCFVSGEKAQFTDQKWMDFLPVFFYEGGLKIVNSLGWNMAPWNFHERKTIKKDNEYYVISRNAENNENIDCLLFVHYSGYDYRRLMKREVLQRNLKGQQVDEDILELLDEYGDSIRDHEQIINKYISMEYKFGKYLNGVTIQYEHRRLYNGLFINRYINLEENPFDQEGNFYKTINKNRMIYENGEGNIEEKKEDPDFIRDKLNKINPLFRTLRRILGFKRYMVFVRFIKRYTTWENQIFHLGEDYQSWI